MPYLRVINFFWATAGYQHFYKYKNTRGKIAFYLKINKIFRSHIWSSGKILAKKDKKRDNPGNYVSKQTIVEEVRIKRLKWYEHRQRMT